MYSASYNWGNIEHPNFDREALLDMKKTCQKHCFSTLNHNLAYCYNDARVIKWLWRMRSAASAAAPKALKTNNQS